MTPRWLLKKLLGKLPQKCLEVREEPANRIIYLFAGTYGDFVQCLNTFNILAEKFSSVDIFLAAPERYYNEFSFLLPEKFQRATRRVFLQCWLKKADVLFTNVISIYRVKWEWIAYFCARNTFGFCYGEEKGRPAYSLCYRLTGNYTNYALINTALIALPETTTPSNWLDYDKHRLRDHTNHNQCMVYEEGSIVLFHLGSNTIKQNLGFAAYMQIITDLTVLLEKKGCSLIPLAGKPDADVTEAFSQKFPKLLVKQFTLAELKSKIEGHQGPILCFDSFMAHYCYWLKKPATVIYTENITPGYDCSSLHHQIVLEKSNNWGLSEHLGFF